MIGGEFVESKVCGLKVFMSTVRVLDRVKLGAANADYPRGTKISRSLPILELFFFYTSSFVLSSSRSWSAQEVELSRWWCLGGALVIAAVDREERSKQQRSNLAASDHPAIWNNY